MTHFKAVITPLGADVIFEHTEDLFLIVWCYNTQLVTSIHIHSDLMLLMVTDCFLTSVAFSSYKGQKKLVPVCFKQTDKSEK